MHVSYGKRFAIGQTAHFQRPANLLKSRRIFFHFCQIRLAAFDFAILFSPFGRKVFDRFGDLSCSCFFFEFLVDWSHNASAIMRGSFFWPTRLAIPFKCLDLLRANGQTN